MSDCFVLYLLLTCMKKKTSGADKFTNNSYWRMAKVLNQIFSNKIIAKLGYTSMLDYYLVVYEN